MNEESQKPVINLPAKDLPNQPITLHEVEEEIEKRLSLIDKEFSRGFDFIKGQPKTVTFFGGSRFPEENEYYQRARRIAAKLSPLGYSIVTGGGPGIMEGANRGAFETEGKSMGLSIKLPNEQVRNPYLTDSIDFYYFFTRKVMLAFSAEAYLFFPGGFGTFDELFEILTLVQTKKIEKVPIILVGSDFWNEVEAFMKKNMLEKNQAIDEQDLSLYQILDDEDAVIKAIQSAPIRVGVRLKHS
ncbi:MAG: TIGR00730 family Rossman fold protein [bacterium]|nr:TIGR00730 family Rossman fold protein [bacterium]